MVATNELLGRAITKHEMKQKLSMCKKTESKFGYKQWVDNTAKIVENEVDLCLLTNQISLRFTPTYNRKEAPRGGINGHYEAIVHLEKGGEKSFVVSNEWVHLNFSEHCLAIIQRIGKDRKETYENRGEKPSTVSYRPNTR